MADDVSSRILAAATLAEQAAAHTPVHDLHGDWCGLDGARWPCAGATVLLPLVDQIIRDLGDGQ